MAFELSALADCDVEVAKGVPTRVVRQIQMERTAGMRIGRPIATVQIDGSGAKTAPATAYVCRVLLSETP
jgi:hypothetical protein